MPSEHNSKLTDAQLAEIMALPHREFIVGNEKKTGLFDAENSKFYITDTAGNLTGKCVTLQVSAPRRPTTPPTPANTETAGAEQKRKWFPAQKKEKSAEATSAAAKSESSPSAKKKAKPILVVALGGALVFLIFSMYMGGGSPLPAGPSVSGGDDGQQGGAPGVIQVVQVKKDFAPGDVIGPEDIQEVSLSSDFFAQVTLAGANLYTWEQSPALVNQYATTFIKANDFLTYEDVDNVVVQPLNPWMTQVNGGTYMAIPIDAPNLGNAELGFGTVVNLEIRKEKVNQTIIGQAPTDNPGDVDGINHTTTVAASTTVETYTMQNLIVCDLLNKQNESLYEKYQTFCAIPIGERVNYLRGAMKRDGTLTEYLTPTYIKVRMTADQAATLGDLSKPGTDVKIIMTPMLNEDTTEKAQFAASSRALVGLIDQAKTANEEEARALLEQQKAQQPENSEG